MQLLLDQAPYLYALILINWFSIKKILTKTTSRSIQALNVKCQDDGWRAESLERDKLVKWLEYSLPATYTIRRDANSKGIIQLWIGK